MQLFLHVAMKLGLYHHPPATAHAIGGGVSRVVSEEPHLV